MGMSKQDLAKRFKALRSSSQTSLAQAIPLAQDGVTVVSDEEATQSWPSLKRRLPLGQSKVVVGETTGISARFEHTLSSKGLPLQEGSSNDIDRFLHKTEVSVAALCDKLSRVSVGEKDRIAELALTKAQLIAAKEEVARLSNEIDGLQGLKVKLKERGERITELETELQQVKDEFAEKERSWRALKEKLANEAASTYGVGFEVALEQVRLLCLLADISAADASKIVLDARLVEE
ncbi:hypothetical protein DEO72_LG7g625 [Vigna unguiculata]|uniref:Uncharacterized protein n=1 Tax=Vigna unguiculata TaxID=3917 RepID=A0A4D6MHY5_VIGUN|nr:hypothetical protein DEO72_LG7g625 [Vigna unguiculata]